MTAKEWRSYLRTQALVSRPDDLEEQMLADLESAEKTIELARDLLEWTCDDDWWCEPGFPEARDAWLKAHEATA